MDLKSLLHCDKVIWLCKKSVKISFTLKEAKIKNMPRFSSQKMSADSNADFCMLHEEFGCFCKIQRNEGCTSTQTGTRPKTYFQNPNKNVVDSKISNKYEKQIGDSIKKYEGKRNHFYKKYLIWRNERLNTISKLQDLLKKVHDDQLSFNKTNMVFKELNVNSRMLKDSNNSTADFLGSLGAFLTDAASGITSMAQAFNIDTYNTELKKIMEDDAEITKPLYITRSQCLEQYRDVEEVMRCFHSETFEDSWENLSKTLKLGDLWLELKNAHEENLVSSTVDCLERFISKNANLATVSKVYDSFGGYIDSNPAALDACKSAGKALCGLYDTWGKDPKQSKSLTAEASRLANMMIICEEKNELQQLRSRVSNSEMTQAKLELKIEDALDSLKAELNEMSNLFNVSPCTIR